MSLEFNPMRSTPEKNLARQQSRDLDRAPLDAAAHVFHTVAEKLIAQPDGYAVRDEVRRFAKEITTAREGVELDGATDKLLNALNLRKVELPGGVDTPRERSAFAVALSRAYLQSLN